MSRGAYPVVVGLLLIAVLLPTPAAAEHGPKDGVALAGYGVRCTFACTFHFPAELTFSDTPEEVRLVVNRPVEGLPFSFGFAPYIDCVYDRATGEFEGFMGIHPCEGFSIWASWITGSSGPGCKVLVELHAETAYMESFRIHAAGVCS